MAWEVRNERKYFYRSRRLPDGRVKKEYFGTGSVGEIASARFAKTRLLKLQLKTEPRDQIARENSFEIYFQVIQSLLNSELHLAGYHNSNSRGWRKRRMETVINGSATKTEEVQQLQTQSIGENSFDKVEFDRIVELAKQGDLDASRKLARIFDQHPELAGCTGDLAARTIWHWIHAIAGDNKHLHQALLCEVKQQRQLLSREGSGSFLEEKAVDLILTTWIQLYQTEIKDLSHPPCTLEFARYRMDRLERLTRRHLKALDMLAKLRSKTDGVKIEQITIHQNIVKRRRKQSKLQTKTKNRISTILDGIETISQN